MVLITAESNGDGDIRYGVSMTSAGGAAIGVGEKPGEGAASAVDGPAPAAKAPSKTAIVLGLLLRDGGATLPKLIDATGWLPHTTRAALTGIHKKGPAVERAKRDSATCYCTGTGCSTEACGEAAEAGCCMKIRAARGTNRRFIMLPFSCFRLRDRDLPK